MHHFEKPTNPGIAEAMLFGILPPLLLSGALEDPKLWVSSTATADFGGVLPVALDSGNLRESLGS